MKKSISPREITITGYVTPVEWDTDDEVISVAIMTDDDEFVVEGNRLGSELIEYLEKDVELTGLLTEESDGTKRILPMSYELLETEGDDDEDEYYGYDDDEDEFRSGSEEDWY